MAAPSIARLAEKNYVGLCRLEVVEVDDMADMGPEIAGSVTTLTLADGVSWSTIYLDDNGGSCTDKPSVNDGLQQSNAVITGAIAKDRLELMPALWTMHGKRYIVKALTRNGDTLLMGRPETPAMAFLDARQTGDDPTTDRNEYRIRFQLSRRLPVPFYVPA